MSKCGLCKRETTCKYKDTVLNLCEKMHPLKMECKYFEHFLEETKYTSEMSSQKNKRKFLCL